MSDLMTVPEVAKRLNTSTDRIYDLARRGMIPAVHMGRLVRFSESALNDWIRAGGSRLSDPSRHVRGTVG